MFGFVGSPPQFTLYYKLGKKQKQKALNAQTRDDAIAEACSFLSELEDYDKDDRFTIKEIFHIRRYLSQCK
jgi:hypothetical protein